MSWASYLWPRAERLLEGEPRVIVRDGQLITGNLRRNRLTSAEIESEMRLTGISHLEDVAWAILEPRGKISFIQRSDEDEGEDKPPPQPKSEDDDGAA
jgi:uncharacterized membrane protein YcaP (DUF421 family)